MARARNIKPGFFTNPELGEIDPLARLLFIGLWTVADRDGRLEDRPKKIKVEILPYDAADVDALLASLQRAGFIIRYQVDTIALIQICNFVKHQNPHPNEKASEFPGVHDDSRSVVKNHEDSIANRASSLNPSSLKDESGTPLADSPAHANAEPATKKSSGSQHKKTRVPDPYPITDYHLKFGKDRGFDEADVRMETERFVNHFTSKGELREQWDASWRNWILQEVKYREAGAKKTTPINGRSTLSAGQQFRLKHGLPPRDEDDDPGIIDVVAKKVVNQ